MSRVKGAPFEEPSPGDWKANHPSSRRHRVHLPPRRSASPQSCRVRGRAPFSKPPPSGSVRDRRRPGIRTTSLSMEGGLDALNFGSRGTPVGRYAAWLRRSRSFSSASPEGLVSPPFSVGSPPTSPSPSTPGALRDAARLCRSTQGLRSSWSQSSATSAASHATR